LLADKVVFTFPLWNFTAPAALTNYLAYIATMNLVGDNKVVMLSACCGVYSVEPMSQVESAVKPFKGDNRKVLQMIEVN
jgi:FMN-dependent NADH-azoreductase